MCRKNSRLHRAFKARALARLSLACLVLALFLYVYLSPYLDKNVLLEFALKGQFSPALYGGFLATVLVIVLLTALAGRFFCSFLCPLGTLQELFWKAGRALLGKKLSMRYRKRPKLRYLILIFTGLGLFFSLYPLMIFFDPISIFGRALAAGRTLLEGGSPLRPLFFASTFILILVIAFFRGRAFCAFCPVGLTLALVSKHSLFGVKIASNCVACGKCEKNCPAACINGQEKNIDNESCVLCFSCAALCPQGSAVYGRRPSKNAGALGGSSVDIADSAATATAAASATATAAAAGTNRREFLKDSLGLACGALYLFASSFKLSRFFPAQAEEGALAILPPGALNERRYRSLCVGCSACIAACPTAVLKAKNSPRPELDYSSYSCQYNCIECGKVCPTGAIKKLPLEEKQRTRIALSSLLFENCVVKTRHESCGACAEVCPTRAVYMADYAESGLPYLTRPIFEEPFCIGCGACLAACPAAPKAFLIKAVPEQSLTRGIRPSEEGGNEALFNPAEDFPF